MAERLPPTPMRMPAPAKTAATGFQKVVKSTTWMSFRVSLLATPLATAA